MRTTFYSVRTVFYSVRTIFWGDTLRPPKKYGQINVFETCGTGLAKRAFTLSPRISND